MVYLFLLAGFVASALFAVLIIPNILLISYKRRLFDIPDSRKVHKVPVPRLGGLRRTLFPAGHPYLILSDNGFLLLLYRYSAE